jgi:uncharacterized protein (TIGR02391 family)
MVLVGGGPFSAGTMTIITDLPDADALLALSPEDLAPIVLRTVVEGAKNGVPIQADSVTYEIFGPRQHIYQARFPPYRKKEIDALVAEAWHVLTAGRLLVPEPGYNGTIGFMQLASRGKQALASPQAFRGFTGGSSLPKEMLHPSIADAVWKALARGDLENAVLDAFKAVEVAVRQAGGFSDTDVGTQLMRRAFDANNGPLADKAIPVPEREALAHIFVGAIGYYKNPQSHRIAKIASQSRAQEMVLIASHLLYIVDERRAPGP